MILCAVTWQEACAVYGSPWHRASPCRLCGSDTAANLKSARGRQLIRDLREAGAVLEFQLTSNVRLNNLSILRHHPLKQYLQDGIACVQGTDGGALYGTDSIDEQLALERLLDLSYEDMMAMKQAEDRVLAASLDTFRRKEAAFAALRGNRAPEAWLEEQIRREPVPDHPLMIGRGRLESLDCLGRMQDWAVELLKRISQGLDPEKVFFVIGYRMLAYERELVKMCGDRFEIFAMVPTQLTEEEVRRLRRSGAGIRISIESVGMGLYKRGSQERQAQGKDLRQSPRGQPVFQGPDPAGLCPDH